MIDIDVLQTALSEMLVQIIAYLPNLLTALILFLLGWAIARLLATITKKIARRLGLDTAVERSGLAEGLVQAGISKTASELLGQLLFWLVLLTFILMAMENLGLTVAITPLQNLISYLPRVLAAILTLVLGALLAQVAGKATQAASAGMGIDFHQGLGKATHGLLMVIVVIITIEQMGLNLTLLTDLFSTMIGIAFAGFALAFGLGGRDVARNVLAGYYARETFSIGEPLVLDEIKGTLEAIGTFSTEIQTSEGTLIIPNARLTDGAVKVSLNE